MNDVSVPAAVAWPAILGGALAAAGLSVALVILGAGLGFAAGMPEGPYAAPAALTLEAVVWLMAVQWISSGVGGYLAGRLRTGWTDAEGHGHEVFFRDTAHGFLAWAAASVLTAAVFASAAAGAAHAGQKAGADGFIAAAESALMRPARPDTPGLDEDTRRETARLLVQGAGKDGLSGDDRAWLSQVVARRAGVEQDEAGRRIDSAVAGLREKTDAARKIAASLSVFTALSMFVGAFIAAVAAALGGKRREVRARP